MYFSMAALLHFSNAHEIFTSEEAKKICSTFGEQDTACRKVIEHANKGADVTGVSTRLGEVNNVQPANLNRLARKINEDWSQSKKLFGSNQDFKSHQDGSANLGGGNSNGWEPTERCKWWIDDMRTHLHRCGTAQCERPHLGPSTSFLEKASNAVAAIDMASTSTTAWYNSGYTSSDYDLPTDTSIGHRNGLFAVYHEDGYAYLCASWTAVCGTKQIQNSTSGETSNVPHCETARLVLGGTAVKGHFMQWKEPADFSAELNNLAFNGVFV
jgi:hypothetical protein